VTEETKQEEETRRKNIKLAIILGLLALGIYVGFILKYF
jgi:uncharacterized membrane protein (DUF485 family)